MKCIRIFPEIWARIRWPLSNETRNMALGSVSATVPWTSIISSFDMWRSPYLYRATDMVPPHLECSQDPGRTTGLNRDRVLEMGRQAAVLRHSGPCIIQNSHATLPHIHHRLKGQHHADLQPRS